MSFSLPAISCYQCSNKTSLDECQDDQVNIDCPLPVHHCGKIKSESTTKEGTVQTTYHKGCVTKDQCNETRRKIVDCCDGDWCNTGYTFFSSYRKPVAFLLWKQTYDKKIGLGVQSLHIMTYSEAFTSLSVV